MISGLINQKIRIYQQTYVPNEYGGNEPANALYWQTSAEVKQLRSTRTTEANQEPLENVFRFIVRYRRDKQIQNNMLLYWRGSWFTINSYNPDLVYNDYVEFLAIASNPGTWVTT